MKMFVAACAAALAAVSMSAASAQDSELGLQVSPVTWQGNVAVVSVELRNLTGRVLTRLPVTCEFVAVGQVLATTRQTVPSLSPGQAVTLEVLADVNGQPIDAVRCSTES